MIFHFFKIARRHFWRNKTVSLLNLLGFVTGTASFFLIVLYIVNERSYDEHFSKADRIYRLVRERQYPDRLAHYAKVGHSWGAAIKDEIPEVEEFCRLFVFKNEGSLFLKIGDQIFEEQNYATADSTFFEIFDLDMLVGDPAKALTEPSGIVLTESTARKYFGQENPLGKTISLLPYSDANYVVTGVCSDVPEQTHFDFDFLFSSGDLSYVLRRPMFVQHNTYTYLLLQEGSNAQSIEAKLPELTDKYSAGQVQENYGIAYQDYKRLGNRYGYYLQPLTDIHLHSQLEEEWKLNGSAELLNFLLIIGIFILLIACINYMNLATAKARERALEIGILKTLGWPRSVIIRQFLTESMLASLLGTLLGVVLTILVLPFFNQLTEKHLFLLSLPFPLLMSAALGLALILGLLAGSYPAMILSSFKPAAALQRQQSSSSDARWFRNGLIVFQYSISIILIICTGLVFQQHFFIMNKPLGFNKDHLLLLKGVPLLGSKKEAFAEELLKINEVNCLSRTSSHVGGYFYGSPLYQPGDEQPLIANGLTAADHFLECLGVDILQGRDFSAAFNDSLSIIINETAARELGLKNPIGQYLHTSTTDSKEFLQVVGVAADFHYQSLYDPDKSLVIRSDYFGWTNNFILRLGAGETAPIIRQIEAVWTEFLPAYPFSYSFMDQEWEYLHRRGEVSKGVFMVFAILAILITCIGLYGLIRYMALQRAKEIGIRKVFGASKSSIVRMLSWEFLRLALIGMLVAFPLAWYFGQRWLQNFAFHVKLDWRLFALGGLAALSITIITITYEALFAASRNPAEVLRNE